MRKIRLDKRRTKQAALLAGVATLFIIAGIVILLVSDTSAYVVISALAILCGLGLVLTGFFWILLMQRSAADRMWTEMNKLSKRLSESERVQREMAENLNAVSASQTRLWDDFERSNNPQLMLKK